MPTLRRLLRSLERSIDPKATFRTDSHPYYPPIIRQVFPNSSHEQVKSRRARVTGQGELKIGGWDPIFSLNHTAAMFRAHVARLVRKTWCTTKKIDCLRDRLILYMVSHNLILTEKNGPRPLKDPQAAQPG